MNAKGPVLSDQLQHAPPLYPELPATTTGLVPSSRDSWTIANVSDMGWQTLGLRDAFSTTMMLLPQCTHSRNDSPDQGPRNGRGSQPTDRLPARPPLIPQFPDNQRASGRDGTYRRSRSVGAGGLLEPAGRRVRGLGAAVKKPQILENQMQQDAFTLSAARPAAPFMGENPVTDNRWELAVVTLAAIAVFFSVWHLVAPLIG
jgi:hypothetical protein